MRETASDASRRMQESALSDAAAIMSGRLSPLVEGGTMPESKREIIANVARLNQFMDRYRLSAVLARSGMNFTYLSGLASPGTLARHLDLACSVRGASVCWPRHGQP